MASHHKTKEAHLWEVLLMDDREREVVARILQGASIALTALQLRTSRDFHQAAAGFSDHASQAEHAELVGGFAAATAAIMATINMEDILRNGG